MKLYPKQSGAVKPDALSTGIKLPNSEVDLIGKVEVCLHHKLADIENFGFIWAGQNTSSPYATTGLYLTSGKNGYSTFFKGSLAANCIILTSALEDDNTYIITSDFNTDNIIMKANKVTIVNNAIVIGSDINGTSTAKGTETLTADIGILSGRTNSAYVYSSKHKIFWIKFYDKQDNLMHEFNFSEGAGSQTFDVITGNACDISNINPTLFWNYTQDFNHYNFRYGFTLYQKSGSPDIRIPNKLDGSEIILPAPPTGYTRIANYKECRQTFNNCENVFVLDDVSAGTQTLIGTFDQTFWGGFPETIQFTQNGTLNGKPVWESVDGDLIRWEYSYEGLAWCIRSHLYLPGIQCYSYDDVESPDLATTWIGRGGTDYVSFELQTSWASDLYAADVDRVLFEEDGTAKEINIGMLDVDLNFNRGYMYINPNIQEHDFMLYKTNKTLKDDEKILKYIGLKDEVVTTEVVNPETLEVTEETVEDENDHVILE